jgi:hypothetical protein
VGVADVEGIEPQHTFDHDMWIDAGDDEATT